MLLTLLLTLPLGSPPTGAFAAGAPAFGSAVVEAPSVAAAALETVEVNLEALTKIKYEPGKPLPDKVLALDGKDVVITGVMHAETGYDVQQFLLVTEACECAASPLPTHFVQVKLKSGTISRKRGELSFRGTFSVGEEIDDNGFVTSLYRLEGEIF